jgi:hypothetical protein
MDAVKRVKIDAPVWRESKAERMKAAKEEEMQREKQDQRSVHWLGWLSRLFFRRTQARRVASPRSLVRPTSYNKMIIYIIVAVVVVVLIALVLRPGAEVNGGSLDLFLGENSGDASDDARKNAQGPSPSRHSSNPKILVFILSINKLWFQSTEAEEAKYSEVYTEEGKQVLVLYATEYGFSEEVRPWLIFIFLALLSALVEYCYFGIPNMCWRATPHFGIPFDHTLRDGPV